jgi:molybdate transport system ATP-binding protein
MSFASLQVEHRVGVLSLRIAFDLTQSWTVLFGPSGSGKTTLLRTIAGFVKPESGRIIYGTNTLSDRTASIFMLPHLRPVRTATQNARLFPHRTVEQNLLFGAGWPSKPQDRLQIANDAMTRFDIAHLANQFPHQLSGGEQQRAAVARALVSATTFEGPCQPLLLLDEPFSGLGTAMRDKLLAELKAWVTQWKIPVLSVTHDIAEAFQLEAEVIKIEDGQVIQQGPAEVVLAEEGRKLLAQLGSPA